MKLYIYWKGIKNKSDMNILIDEEATHLTPTLVKDIAQELGKVVTPDTKAFQIIQRGLK